MFGDHYEHVSHKFSKNLLSPHKNLKSTKVGTQMFGGELTMFHVNIRFTLNYGQCPKILGQIANKVNDKWNLWWSQEQWYI
jgi:hypothetical protein